LTLLDNIPADSTILAKMIIWILSD